MAGAPAGKSDAAAQQTGLLGFLQGTTTLVKTLTALLAAVVGLLGGLKAAGVIDRTHVGAPAVHWSESSSSWDSNTKGSHWHGILTWDTTAQVRSCRLQDDQGTPSVAVDAAGKGYPFGSYPGGVGKVVATVECKGPGGTGKSSINVQVPQAPPMRMIVSRTRSEWIDAARTHWQAVLTWSSNGVDCSLWDDVQKQWFHKDPRGEGPPAGAYGYFARTIPTVNMRLRCTDVAAHPFVKSFSVDRPSGGNGL